MAAALLLFVPRVATAQVEITRRDPSAVTKTFNPDRPPREMPPLRDGEAAVCESKFLCQVQVEVEVSTAPGERPECRITGIKSEVRLDVVIWLPTDGTAKIRAHEDGHRRISEHFYADAEQIAKRIAEEYIGQELEIKSADPSDTRPVIQRIANEFCQKYLAAVEMPSEKVQMKYDQLTDHGRNKLGEREAIKRALTSVTPATKPSAAPAR